MYYYKLLLKHFIVFTSWSTYFLNSCQICSLLYSNLGKMFSRTSFYCFAIIFLKSYLTQITSPSPHWQLPERTQVIKNFDKEEKTNFLSVFLHSFVFLIALCHKTWNIQTRTRSISFQTIHGTVKYQTTYRCFSLKWPV